MQGYGTDLMKGVKTSSGRRDDGDPGPGSSSFGSGGAKPDMNDDIPF